jgi:hypothetical protein
MDQVAHFSRLWKRKDLIRPATGIQAAVALSLQNKSKNPTIADKVAFASILKSNVVENHISTPATKCVDLS